MNETFFGGSAAAASDAEASQEAADASGEEQTISVEAAAEETPQAVETEETAASVSEAVMPAFGLVRVEPDGSAVIAGNATPSGEVRIFANDDQIGTETAQASGDFAFVTDAPLPTGGVELRILDVETDRYADTSIVVVVQDDRTSEPLVIASAPGEASEILQGLDGPAASVAMDEDVSEGAGPDEATAENLVVADAEMADPNAGSPDESPETAAVVAPAEGEAESQESLPDAADEQAGAVRDDETESPEVAIEEQATRGADDLPDEEADSAGESVSVQPAGAEQQDAQAGAEQPDPASASTSVAAEQDVAEPAASDAAPVQEESDAAENMQVAEGDPVEDPVQTSPADNAASPAASADEPASTPALAADPEPAADAPESAVAQSGAQPEQSGENAVASAQQQAFSAPTIDAVEIDGDRNFFAGAGEDGFSVRLYVDNSVVGSTEVNDGRWLIEAIDVLDQENQRIRIDMLAPDGSVVGRAEVDFILELPATLDEDIVVAEQGEVQADGAGSPPSGQAQAPADAIAETPAAQDGIDSAPATDPVGSADPEIIQPTERAEQPETVEPGEPSIPTLVGVSDGNRTATGLAIIRQGDNLWTIARRVYGEGIRYTQIFEANTDQIRNPDLIYPGQVFDLPGTDEVVGEANDAPSAQ